MREFTLAIDPGKSGGLAWTTPAGPRCAAMPPTDDELVQLLHQILSAQQDEWRVIVERVGGYCGKGQPGSAMFTFGRGYGFILGVLAGWGMEVELVTPQTWQKPLALGTVAQAGGKTLWKTRLKDRAQAIYPRHKVTLNTADALLLLEWGVKNTQKH